MKRPSDLVDIYGREIYMGAWIDLGSMTYLTPTGIHAREPRPAAWCPSFDPTRRSRVYRVRDVIVTWKGVQLNSFADAPVTVEYDHG